MNGGVYLALHQHGDVHKHVMQLLYAALQTHNVFVTCFNLTQRLFGDPWIHNLQHKRQIYHGVAWTFTFNKDFESVRSFAQFRANYHRNPVEMESRSCGLGFETLIWPESHYLMSRSLRFKLPLAKRCYDQLNGYNKYLRGNIKLKATCYIATLLFLI